MSDPGVRLDGLIAAGKGLEVLIEEVPVEAHALAVHVLQDRAAELERIRNRHGLDRAVVAAEIDGLHLLAKVLRVSLADRQAAARVGGA